MKKGLVSVVLPIYNVEKYLNRCVISVINQTYKNLEIILVDDGSPDNCPRLCDEWAKKDARIKVVHKINDGLGMARNTGIEQATGEYITFVDSDDYIDPNLIEKAFSSAKKNNSDTVCYGYKKVSSNGVVDSIVLPITKSLVYTGESVQNIFLANLIGPNLETGERTNLWMSVCGTLISLDLINRTAWRFTSERDIISEDVFSLLQLYKNVKCVSVLSDALYYYCENNNSLTHQIRTDRLEKNNHFYQECIKLCKENNYPSDVIDRIAYQYLSNIIGAMKQVVQINCTEGEKRKQIETIVHDSIIQSVVHSYNYTKETCARKILLESIKKKWSIICYCLIKLKVNKEKLKDSI